MNRSSRPQAIEPLPQLLRLPEVLKATGLSRSTIYRMIAEGRSPAPVRLGRRAVAWRHEDVRQWMIARPTPDADAIASRLVDSHPSRRSLTWPGQLASA